MLYQNMSSTLTKKGNKNCKGCQQFNNTRLLLLSIIWTILFTQTMARPNLETLLEKAEQQKQQQQPQQLQQDMFLDEIITNSNGDKLFNKLRKYHRNQANNYLNKWPGLRDLVLAFDYEDNNGQENSHEFWNSKFFDRLRQLVSLDTDSYDSDDYTRDDSSADFDSSSAMVSMKSLKTLSPTNQLIFKDHNIKKNIQYMSPCHFKICNMGRKRNARYFTNY